MFDGNKGYYSHVHGSKLNSCHWKEKTAFQLLTPGDVYKRILHLDVNIKNVISRQYTMFCICEGETHTDCITDHFSPIFPGQTIPVKHKQALPIDKAFCLQLYIHRRFFTISKRPIPYKQCKTLLKIYVDSYTCHEIYHNVELSQIFTRSINSCNNNTSVFNAAAYNYYYKMH